MNYRLNRQLDFLVVLVWAIAAPAFANSNVPLRATGEIRSTPAAVVLADSWSIGKIFYGGGRTRIVQVCAVVMSIALFIMMRKLN